MKKKILFVLLFFLVIRTAPAQSTIVKTSFTVYGNCAMCKKRIETALDHKGIKQVSWSPKTKQLDVVYNSAKITELQIHELVAAAGHDTDKVKAKDEKYATLPFCCLYRENDSTTDHPHQ